MLLLVVLLILLVVLVVLVVVAAVFLPKHVSVTCHWADRDNMPNRIKHSVLTVERDSGRKSPSIVR